MLYKFIIFKMINLLIKFSFIIYSIYQFTFIEVIIDS